MIRAKSNVNALRGTTNSLAIYVDKSNETVTKEYLAITTNITAAKTNAIDSIAEETTKMKTLLVKSLGNLTTAPTSTPTPFQKVDNPNDYFIDGQTWQIRLYKFVKDNTPIDCESSTGVLLMYIYLATIAAQYDIYMTPLDNVQKWIGLTSDNPSPTHFNPWFWEHG